MPAFDPTSVAHSLPAAPNRPWGVEDIARLQAEVVEALVRPAATPAGATAAVTGSAAPSTTDAAGVCQSTATSSSAAQHTRISGRYRAAGDTELELRIDVDGNRPTRCVSGDFFRRTGGTLAYAGSFVVNTPDIVINEVEVRLEGEGVFNFASGSPRLRVTIPRVPALMPRAAATARFLTSAGIPGATFICTYESDYFRTVEFEQDLVDDVTAFMSYNTGQLPSGGPARVLTVTSAYAEAGIELVDTGYADTVPIALAGANRIWADRELHAAMLDHFSRWTPNAAWRVWLLAATAHEDPRRLRGLMFDDDRRQGCAVFHDVVGGNGDQVTRAMLRTYMHELGHCFNLYHSHEKRFMRPPQADRLDALSWMHYPAYYRSAGGTGESAFWRSFPFQFDDQELMHLRHGFRDAVVPGGQPFGLGGADLARDAFADPVADASGLTLEIRAPERAILGAPVVVELKLSLSDLRGRIANAVLHPNFGYVQIGIVRPGRGPITYRPLIAHCAEPDLVTLNNDRPSVYDSVYIGFGKDGFYFDAPGQYDLRAVYNAPDGSTVLSNVLRLRVTAPANDVDDEVADLFLGTEHGTLLYLLGSDGATLERGRNAAALMLDKYPNHPLASYARLTEGINTSRPFKTIVAGRVECRATDYERSARLLSDLVESTTVQSSAYADAAAPVPKVPRLDNISLNMAMRRLAEVRKTGGDEKAAAEIALRAVEYFDAQGVPAHVRRLIVDQVSAYLRDEQVAELKSERFGALVRRRADPSSPPGGRRLGAEPSSPPAGPRLGADPSSPPPGPRLGADPSSPPSGPRPGADPSAPPLARPSGAEIAESSGEGDALELGVYEKTSIEPSARPRKPSSEPPKRAPQSPDSGLRTKDQGRP